MKKFIGAATGFITSALLVPQAFADNISLCPQVVPGTPSSDFNPLCDFTAAKTGQYLGVILTLMFLAAVIIALIFLVWGGIKWILSGGDKAEVDNARKHIIAAIVGLAITFLAYFLLGFIIRLFLPSFSFENIALPHF